MEKHKIFFAYILGTNSFLQQKAEESPSKQLLHYKVNMMTLTWP